MRYVSTGVEAIFTENYSECYWRKDRNTQNYCIEKLFTSKSESKFLLPPLRIEINLTFTQDTTGKPILIHRKKEENVTNKTVSVDSSITIKTEPELDIANEVRYTEKYSFKSILKSYAFPYYAKSTCIFYILY